MIRFDIGVEIERPVGEVFAYVTDPATLHTWQTNTVSVTREPDGPLGLGTILHEVHRAPGGRELASVVAVAEYEPDRLLTLRIVEGQIPLDGRFAFTAVRGATRVELHGSGRLSGPLRLMQPVLRHFIRRQFERDLDTLKHVLEERAPT